MFTKEKGSNFSSQLIKILLVLIVAGVVSYIFIQTKPEPKRRNINLLPSKVSVIEVNPISDNILVEAMGVVQPMQELSIISEVGGRVEWINDKLIPGGFIRKGETIVKIEKTDYEIALEQAKANLATAKKDLLVEEGEARSAKVMEDMSKLSSSKQARQLRMRIPHIEAAEANLNAAEKLLEQAEKDLERTDIIAPFSIIVGSENIELGNYVTRLSVIAEAVGTASYWVEVTLPVSKVYYINIPGVNSQTGSTAKIIYKGANGKETVKTGKVIRLFGSLDTLGRMAKILIEVDDPLGLESDNMDEMLLLNSYVEVEIEGKRLDNLLALPREYLHAGDIVWVVGKDSKLVLKQVEIVWRDKDKVYITAGLNQGDKVIISNNFVPVAGMNLLVSGVDKGDINE